jgi:hypothetical protein
MATYRLSALLIVLIFLVGCASIPPEAPMLSQELGVKVSAIEDAHINLLHKFFDQKRQQVDKFIEEVWIPDFAEEIFNDEKVKEVWDTIVRENNVEDRLKFIVLLGPKLQKKINSKRLQLIQPLEELERTIEQKLRSDYDQARSINNSLTSFLLSAAKIDENRKKYLELLGVKDAQITKIIDKTDQVCNTLVAATGEVEDKVALSKAFLGKLKEIKNSF